MKNVSNLLRRDIGRAKRIYIVGFMGCGKTTFGKTLARNLSYRFVDLDKYIEVRTKKNPANIILVEGERCFRKIEAQLLREVSRLDKIVVSCGGGTPCFKKNMEFMSRRGCTVWLVVGIGEITRRLRKSSEKKKRPLWSEHRNQNALLYEARSPYYRMAKIWLNGEKSAF